MSSTRLHIYRSPRKVAVVAGAFFAAMAVLIATLSTETPVSAQSNDAIRVISTSATSEFPEGMRFKLEVESDFRIDDIRVTYEIGARGTTQYAYLDIDQTTRPLVNGELFQRPNTNSRYIPPGTMIVYWFEITDENGDSILTERNTFRFDDARFEWEEVNLGAITILYHGPVRVRAERLAEAAVESLEIMGPVTGAEIETRIIMTLYNNNAEMIEAVVARSLPCRPNTAAAYTVAQAPDQKRTRGKPVSPSPNSSTADTAVGVSAGRWTAPPTRGFGM